jgi:hypothetical protein
MRYSRLWRCLEIGSSEVGLCRDGMNVANKSVSAMIDSYGFDGIFHVARASLRITSFLGRFLSRAD